MSQTFNTVLPVECRSLARSATHCAHVRLRATTTTTKPHDDGEEDVEETAEAMSADSLATVMCADNRTRNQLMLDSRQYAWLGVQLGERRSTTMTRWQASRMRRATPPSSSWSTPTTRRCM